MNGKTMGPYGATWVIKYYDGAQRITNGGKVSNWKPLDAGATLKLVWVMLLVFHRMFTNTYVSQWYVTTFTEKIRLKQWM